MKQPKAVMDDDVDVDDWVEGGEWKLEIRDAAGIGV